MKKRGYRRPNGRLCSDPAGANPGRVSSEMRRGRRAAVERTRAKGFGRRARDRGNDEKGMRMMWDSPSVEAQVRLIEVWTLAVGSNLMNLYSS